MASLTLDPDGCAVICRGERRTLTKREFGVIAALIEASGTAVPSQDLLERVWGPNTPTPNLRVAIANLRRKLELDPELPTLIVTEPGVGYRLAD